MIILSQSANYLYMTLMANQYHFLTFSGIFLNLKVDLHNQRTSCIKHVKF